MKLYKLFKSILDQDIAPVVVCDIDDIIVYMNPCAIKRYHKDLTGKSIKDCHPPKANEQINKVVAWFKESKDNNIIYMTVVIIWNRLLMQVMRMLNEITKRLITAVTVLFTMMKTICHLNERTVYGICFIVNVTVAQRLLMIIQRNKSKSYKCAIWHLKSILRPGCKGC